ncbi:MAG: ROK family protein [Bacteroidia bacterium]|nr:ROK family protein [Bacteroidia bacterium]
MQSLAIGIDLGGTNIKGVLIDQEGNTILDTKTETIEKDDTHWKQAVAEMIQNFKAKADSNVTAIGLCAPGLANAENNCISFMPGRMNGLENFNWSDWVGENIAVLNDAHAAIVAEAKFGVAKGLQHAALISLGTGVGGAILINGKLYQGFSQMAGHIGHSTINAETSERDVTNMAGSIESAIGNISLADRSHGKYQTTEELVNDFRKGDYFASWVWLSSVRKLAINIASVINILSPEVVILSGGIIQAKDALLEPLQDFLDHYEWRPGGKKTPVKFAHFSDHAGAVGAAAFAFSKMK